MARIPRISDAEWEVMKIVWARSPLTAGEIIEALAWKKPPWHPKTVKTLLNRLVKKGALGYEEVDRAYHYLPAVREADCVLAASESFLRRVFGGSLKPMLAQFVEQKKITPDEIKELRRILDNKGR